MSEYMILGTDDHDAEKQRDLWLNEHLGIKINRVHSLKREPPNWLTRFGGKNVPRVSILIDYELLEAAEYRKPNDFAELFKELQQLRSRVYKAELDFSAERRSPIDNVDPKTDGSQNLRVILTTRPLNRQQLSQRFPDPARPGDPPGLVTG
jgi:hypothetical protein